MIEVMPNLFVGSDSDYIGAHVSPGWTVIHAAKEPWHRKMVGYEGKAAPQGEEYLVARRGNEIALNLVDAQDEKYIPVELIETALEEIERGLKNGEVLIHCNKGESRAPSIALMYMARHGNLPAEYADALDKFIELYDDYTPGQGMADFMAKHWDEIIQ